MEKLSMKMDISTKATFEYEYTQNPESVKIINFKNIK